MKRKNFLALKLTDVVFILLLNVKMPAFMSRINFMCVEFCYSDKHFVISSLENQLLFENRNKKWMQF